MNRFTSMSLAGAMLALVACGGDDDDGPGGTVDPNGTHTQYVINDLSVPMSTTEAAAVGLDLAGSSAPDNALGGLLATLGGFGLDTSTTVDTNIQNGTVILLADVQATDLTAATGVGLQVLLGANPTPAACTDPADPATCGGHLTGTGSFELSPDSPSDALLVGSIVGGRLTAGPGTVTLSLPIAEGAPPIVIDLIGAQVEVNVTATGMMSGKLGGAITMVDIMNELLPAVTDLIGDLITRDCTGAAPDCCADPESTGAQILSILDANDDCMVPQAELEENDIIGSTLLNPDVDMLDGTTYSPDTDGMKDSLSLGVGFTAVNGTFTLP